MTPIAINQTWFDCHLNKFYDLDGVYGSQCVDLFKQILKEMGHPNPAAPIGGDGWAQNIWYNREKWSKYFDAIPKSQVRFGDVIIFSKGGDTPSSHVGVCAGYTSTGRIICFGQNQGGLKRAGDQGSACNYTSLSVSSLLGGLRPKAGTAGKKVKWNYDAVLNVGDVVSSKTMAITKIDKKTGLITVPALGGEVPAADLTESDLTKDGACDQVLKDTNAKVWLTECVVEDIDEKTECVQVHGYWVKAKPLCRKEYV